MRTIDECNENDYRLLVAPNTIRPLRQLAQSGAGPLKIASEALFGVHRELVITHNGREYRLRVTQNGKLILTA